ncbi:LNR domain protein [Pelomyxa schiedti]|nr:LNR domain protein [Pelomyxa schiedti]
MRCVIALLSLCAAFALATKGWGDLCYGRSGDGKCDMACYTRDNFFDKGDCDGLCNPGCYNSSIGDGNCDSWCMTEECNYDGGDCGDGGVCGDWNCRAEDWGNGACNYECANAECAWDGGDCVLLNCARLCTVQLIGNGYCDTICEAEECFWDGFDCEDWCAESCHVTMVGDGHCDMHSCYNEACNWDGGDCDVPLVDYCDPPKCLRSQVGDGHCDSVCFNDYCDMDGGDCDGSYCGQMDGYNGYGAWYCYDSAIGNNHCDAPCNNADCGYDGGDCNFSRVLYIAELVDNTCTGEALTVTAHYCTNENDWQCEPYCSSLFSECQPENVLQGCATVAEFDSLLDDWFKEEPAWTATFPNVECEGTPKTTCGDT